MSKHSTPAYSWPSISVSSALVDSTNLRSCTMFAVHTGWISSCRIHECGGPAMRLKHPESSVSTADPAGNPLWILRDKSIPARRASLCLLRTGTGQSVALFRTRQSQRSPVVSLLCVLTVCLHTVEHTATTSGWAVSSMDGSHKCNLSEGS